MVCAPRLWTTGFRTGIFGTHASACIVRFTDTLEAAVSVCFTCLSSALDC